MPHHLGKDAVLFDRPATTGNTQDMKNRAAATTASGRPQRVRAAALFLSVEQFMEFTAQHNVPLHCGVDELEEDRRTLERLGL